MLRTLLALVLSIILSASVAVPATFAQAPEAAKTAKAAPAKKTAATKTATTKLAPGQKLCKSKQPAGTTKTWTCGNDQPCCVNHSMNLYTCGSQLLKCF